MLDSAVFKFLSHNDTGAAKGHQGGIVIPKDIARFFPPLQSDPATPSPAVDLELTAELIVDGRFLSVVNTRYQYQTWGGERSPEYRLTRNLGALRNSARKGDLILIRKDLLNNTKIQIHLIRKGSSEYSMLFKKFAGKRWGIVNEEDPPVSVDEIYEEEKYLERLSEADGTAFDESRKILETSTKRKARDRTFRIKVLSQYGFRCSFTGKSFILPKVDPFVGVDAAHIVPVSAGGSDHPANGLALSKDMHWCFDNGLIGVDSDRRIIVPETVRKMPENDFLNSLHGEKIREAEEIKFRALDESFQWHRNNILIHY